VATVSRRKFLHYGMLGSVGAALSACQPGLLNQPPLTPTPFITPTPRPSPEVIVGDVLDYQLTSNAWPGDFGSVTFRIHEALYEGLSVYYIITDTSNEDFARDHTLVWTPLLLGAEEAPIANIMYMFDEDHLPVMRSVPGDDDFIALFEIVNVRGSIGAMELASAEQIISAAEADTITLEPTNIFVNQPVVKWPGGELAVDDDRTTYLGTGQLLEPVDTEAMTVMFKLHEGYPGDRYIVTDTSAVERAPNMHIAPAAATWPLVEHNAVDELFVFANGIPGPGVMGFQPAVFDSTVDSLVWSPFWNHFTVQWIHEENARILHNSFEVYDALDRGELERFNGTPDSHPEGFVVNCPVPVLAANTFG